MRGRKNKQTNKQHSSPQQATHTFQKWPMKSKTLEGNQNNGQ